MNNITLSTGIQVGNLILRSRHNHAGDVCKTIVGDPIYSNESINLVLCAPTGGEIMYNDVTRIPSHMNVRYKGIMPAHFRMSDLMLSCTSHLGECAKAIGIVNDFICSGPRKNLKNSDLYHLHFIVVHKPYTKEELIPVFLSQVSDMIRMLTSDPHPVIVASPEVICTKSDFTAEDIPMVTQMLLNAGFQPVRKNSKWFYLSK